MGFALDNSDEQLNLPETLVPARCTKTKQFFHMKFRTYPDGSVELMAGIKAPEPGKNHSGSGKPSVTLDYSKGYKASAQYSCPYCGARHHFQCGTCGGISCWDGQDYSPTCPHCEKKCNISGDITSVDGNSNQGN